MILKCYKCSIFIIFITKFTVHSALLSETILKGTCNTYCTVKPKHCVLNGNQFAYKDCEVPKDCTGKHQYCDTEINKCECEPNYEYRFDTTNCSPCPLEGETCKTCCYYSYLKCEYNLCIRSDGYYDVDLPQDVFMNASQIALVAALIMGALALATLLYRICTKPSYFGSRRTHSNGNAEATESTFQQVSRASLSSIQVRVISRLRDRPPKYETQHNYDMRIQRQEEETQRSANSNVDVSTISAVTAEHAPPPYDGSKESVHELPPPYSDTGHETLADILIPSRNTSSQIGGTSQSSENSTISIISNGCTERDIINENKSDKEDKAIHI